MCRGARSVTGGATIGIVVVPLNVDRVGGEIGKPDGHVSKFKSGGISGLALSREASCSEIWSICFFISSASDAYFSLVSSEDSFVGNAERTAEKSHISFIFLNFTLKKIKTNFPSKKEINVHFFISQFNSFCNSYFSLSAFKLC
ncbi:hypothetical protein TRFO_05506 [Tritrichomonas foetus]|uniref:Uncharacterized protein n=1 Tax=Tritrichomonas foetus TaxID=1144522 RepID=A0A1J4K5W5_9EUKA|nr:hypothetical protein TRFO_05506 [Tritrichomonas foetus]|eukprot:OHT06799.1 hypothetical protein TRFO_05506 [Tritrichomonas foetus]